MSIEEILSFTYFYDKISDVCSISRISFAFNDFYVLKIQVMYSRILVMRCHLCEYDVRVTSREISKDEFFEYLFNQVVSRAKTDIIVRIKPMLEKSCMMHVVFVYTNGRTVQDIKFTIQPVDLKGFQKRSFKTESYLSYYRRVSVDLSKLSECILTNIIHVRIVGKYMNDILSIKMTLMDTVIRE